MKASWISNSAGHFLLLNEREIIASVRKELDGGWRAELNFPHSTGNQQQNWSIHKTYRGSQRWLERELARFWEPPTITNPVLGNPWD